MTIRLSLFLVQENLLQVLALAKVQVPGLPEPVVSGQQRMVR